MKIIVGSYQSLSAPEKELQARVEQILEQLVRLLPALSCSKVVVPLTANRKLQNRAAGSALNDGWTQLLTALEKQTIDCALYLADEMPEQLPEAVDSFVFPGRPSNRSLPAAMTTDIRLALAFRQGEDIFTIIRNLLLPPTIFAGAGIGGADNVTQAVINALKNCEICVFDALIPDGILEYLPAGAEPIFVGKRNGHHHMKQKEINLLLVSLAKSGKKVVRLKGGDPTVFGRLAEETETFEQEKLPFRVLPGISTLNVAAASTGLLPTRRGANRSFTVSTPRRAGSHEFTPLQGNDRKEFLNVYYMSATMVPEIVEQMGNEGFASDWPITLIYDVGSSRETLVCGTLVDIVAKISRPELKKRPALILTGKTTAAKFLFQTNAPLAGKKVLCCGEKAIIEQGKAAIEGLGGRCILLPLSMLKATQSGEQAVSACNRYEQLLITSVSSAEMIFDIWRQQQVDLRTIPSLIVENFECAAVFNKIGIFPELVLCQEGVVNRESASSRLNPTGLKKKITWLKSESDVGPNNEWLQAGDKKIEELVFAKHYPLPAEPSISFDAVLFSEIESLRKCTADFGPQSLTGKVVTWIGGGIDDKYPEHIEKVVGKEATETIHQASFQLAAYYSNQKLITTDEEKNGRKS